MKGDDTHIKMEASNLIRVDFRKDRLSIDFDIYFNGVKEIHCRICSQRKPRKGAVEVPESWGYFCRDCGKSLELTKSFQLENKESPSPLPEFQPAGNEKR
ncbi:MAG: hypothetical protein OEV42_03100 [Deltaproteobacteria bacterium]|nr:hypothetical protein [Deltaproteobacteria bacterium]